MSENPHETISVKGANGRLRKFNVYWDAHVFPKSADKHVVDEVIEMIKASPEEYLVILQKGGAVRVQSQYRHGHYFTVKRNSGASALLITK